LVLPVKPYRLTRRSIIATGLAAAAGWGNYARAQVTLGDLPDAAIGLGGAAPRPAPDLKFLSATGKNLSLAGFRGAGLVVNIWASWCPPCIAELPSFAAIAPKLAASKILVLPISIDYEGLKVVQPFYTSHKIANLPILLDPDGTVADTLGGPGIPITIVINPAGQIVARLDGAANWDTPATLARLQHLAGAPVPRPESGFQPV
jgi:thiol-disulfide isomerase/thioredoxin